MLLEPDVRRRCGWRPWRARDTGFRKPGLYSVGNRQQWKVISQAVKCDVSFDLTVGGGLEG